MLSLARARGSSPTREDSVTTTTNSSNSNHSPSYRRSRRPRSATRPPPRLPKTESIPEIFKQAPGGQLDHDSSEDEDAVLEVASRSFAPSHPLRGNLSMSVPTYSGLWGGRASPSGLSATPSQPRPIPPSNERSAGTPSSTSDHLFSSSSPSASLLAQRAPLPADDNATRPPGPTHLNLSPRGRVSSLPQQELTNTLPRQPVTLASSVVYNPRFRPQLSTSEGALPSPLEPEPSSATTQMHHSHSSSSLPAHFPEQAGHFV